MCTRTDTTNEPRDINVLLGLETYQGMTDEEIELVIAYRVGQQLATRESLTKAAALAQVTEQTIADNAASARRALDMLQSIVETTFPNIEPVKPKTFTARSTEV